jgi:hypothetical protein
VETPRHAVAATEALHRIFCSAEPLCIATCSVLSLFIWMGARQ